MSASANYGLRRIRHRPILLIFFIYHHHNLALIEAGKRVPNLDVLVHIAEITDVSIDYLIFGDNKEPNSLQLTLERLNKSYPQRNVEHALMLAEYYLKLEKGLFDTKDSTN